MKIPQISLVPLKSRILSEEALVFFSFEGNDGAKKELARVLGKGEVDTVVDFAKKRKYQGKEKEVVQLPVFDDTLVILIGLGKGADFSLESIRIATNKALEVLEQMKIPSGVIVAPKTPKGTNQEVVGAITEGIVLGGYDFDKYKSDPEEKDEKYSLAQLNIAVDSVTKSLEQERDTAVITSEGTLFARDLANENSDQINPKTFADQVAKVAQGSPKLRSKILADSQLRKEKLNLIEAVGKAAEVGPRLAILEYHGRAGKDFDTALVGKGVTFDTGGVNLKPAGPVINQMHIDMAGAATVLATITTADKLKLKKNIIGVMPLAENALGSRSFKPGSILVSHSGKSVEIIHTDAEGRLLLADALSYVIENYSSKNVIDVATLTGGVVVALGFEAAGLFTNDKTLGKELLAAAQRTHERLWELPLYKEYEEDLKSDSADLVNLHSSLGGSSAAAVMAAIFLKNFVGDEKWAHLDIAGTAMLDKPKDYRPKNATGFGVRLLVNYLSK